MVNGDGIDGARQIYCYSESDVCTKANLFQFQNSSFQFQK